MPSEVAFATTGVDLIVTVAEWRHLRPVSPSPYSFIFQSIEYFIHSCKTTSSYIVIFEETSASVSAFVRSRSRRSHTGHVSAVALMYLVILCCTLHSWVMYFDPSNGELYILSRRWRRKRSELTRWNRGKRIRTAEHRSDYRNLFLDLQGGK